MIVLTQALIHLKKEAQGVVNFVPGFKLEKIKIDPSRDFFLKLDREGIYGGSKLTWIHLKNLTQW